jgi:peptidoglycan hydrolase-like protein with peptidoglycan-binding domain
MATKVYLMLRRAAPSRRRLRRLLRTRRRLEARTVAAPGLFAIVLLLASTPALAQSCRVDFAPGQEGPALRDIQAQLQAHGFRAGPIDGVLGPKTCAAVRAYQKAAGLPIDGVIDPKLQNHMHFIAKKPG